ncbi:CinA family protein [Microbacterium kyungheense]|uniref:Nicotinamide-nucleotide amidase n=1 Tax=Microbacterium kyungheense TaxID=1263636 RepID=A0A543EDZ7_9MICO|nr:CinA family protein [Microbacterium kyungheense]TQM19834.1 nicotinamide-nucleotide amidase [Microbacterium kyungheense]
MKTDAERLAHACRSSGVRIAVAESLTSGMLASAVGSGPDAQEWFCGGIVAYRTEVKERLLGLPTGIDPCSDVCATQLAAGARELLSADIAVSTTGVGGPDPEDGHPPGTVYLGWATATDSGARLLTLSGDPEEVLTQTVDAALALLLDRVSDAPSAAH